MKTFLFQGDSVTDAGRNREDDYDLGFGYPRMVAEYFEKKYPAQFSFVNTGTSGDTSACIYARMGTEILNIHPDYMSLLVGFNDISHLITNNDGIAPHRYEQLLCMLIEDVTQALPDIKIIMLEPYVLKGVSTEPNWTKLNPGVRNNASIAKRVAEKYGFRYKDIDQNLNNGVMIYRSEIFAGNRREATMNSYAIHYCETSWVRKSFLDKLSHYSKFAYFLVKSNLKR